MSKNIKVIRGGCKSPLLRKYDNFNSVIEVENKIFNNCNTDYYFGYKGGIISEGNYYYICALRENGNKVIYLTNQLICDKKEMTEKMRVFPSLVPNPNHANEKIITQVLIHSDGVNGGWSHGCITIYPSNWKEFISMFEINDCGEIEIIRDKNWKIPQNKI